jgi:hypothetical protein
VDLYQDLTGKDRDILFSQGMVSINPDTWRLVWNEEKWGDYTGRFEPIKKLCDTGSLVVSRGNVLLWEFPCEFLRCFEAVWLATYMFDASPFSAYLKAEGFTFNRLTISGRRMVPWGEAPDEAAIKAKIRKLVSVYEGPANDIGNEEVNSHPMSSGWYSRQPLKVLDRLKASRSNFFRSIAKTPSNVNGWTTFKSQRIALEGTGYSRDSSRESDSYGFIPWNCRVTNDYAKVEAMAYLCNVYFHPIVKGYFEDLGVNVSNDLHALSTLVQWVWRSRVRNDGAIKVYIPSERMRDLLKQWLVAHPSFGHRGHSGGHRRPRCWPAVAEAVPPLK